MPFIGVIGTSGYRNINPSELRVIIEDLLCHPNIKGVKDITFVVGGGVVPTTFLSIAQKYLYECICIAPACVKYSPPNTRRITIGEKHGDDSEYFIDFIDSLIRIGGGPQSHKEVEMFKEQRANVKKQKTGFLIERELKYYTRSK